MNNRLLEKISKFQKNPQEALKECENDTEAQIFLKEFLKVMGTHLTSGEFDASKKKSGAEIEVEDPEQRKANELINNSEVRELLMDPEVQNLFMLLRNNPENSQRLVIPTKLFYLKLFFFSF